MSLVAMRDQVVKELGELELSTVPGKKVFRTAVKHGGRFDQPEVNRYARATPTAMVALASIEETTSGWPDDKQATARWVVFIMTTGTSVETRDDQALALVDLTTGHIMGNVWDGKARHAPTRIRSTNLYSGTLDGLGTALWVVEWDQQVDVGDIAAVTDDFKTWRALWETVESDGDLVPTEPGNQDAEDVVDGLDA